MADDDQEMTPARLRLQGVVQDLEEVMRRHDVTGVAAVADGTTMAYGVRLQDGPVTLSSEDTVRIDEAELLNANHIRFYTSLEGAVQAAAEGAKAVAGLFKCTLTRVMAAKMAREGKT